MIRRARWLAVGAVLGALGYQRLHRAARSLTSQSDSVPAAQQAVGLVGIAAGAAGHAAGAAGWLARQALRRRAARRRQQSGVAGFISDVRDGMGDYLDRHEASRTQASRGQANMNRQYPRSGNTLVGQLQDDKTKDGC